MISLRSLMAIDMKGLGPIALIIGAAILVIAFAIGMVKGVRKVNKSGILWLTASVGFIFVYKLFGKNNFLKGVFTGKLASFAELAWAFLLVIACIAATMALGLVVSIIIRPIPKDKKPIKKRKKSKDEELSFEEAKALAEDERAYKRAKEELEEDDEKKMGFFTRLFGGFACLLNVLAYVGFIAVFVLVVLKNSKIGGYIEPMLANATVNKLFSFASKYIFDIITIGIVMCIARSGFDVGFVRTARNVVRRLGMVLVVIAAFVLPFLAFFDKLALVQTALGAIKGILPQWGVISDILSRVILGGGIAIIGVIIVAILNVLLRTLMYAIDDTKVVRAIDSVLAAILYVVLSILVCVFFWGVFYVINYFGLISIKKMILDTPSFARECFYLAKEICKYVVFNYFPALV